MSGFVGAQHEFHDAAFVQGWADRFVPTPPRIALFDLILERVSAPDLPNAHVLELGLGPGYMARHILERNPGLSYEGLDFSEVFFDVARKTIGRHMPRVQLTKANLIDQAWPHSLSRQPGAIVSTWALHDLGGQQAVADVYARCHEVLPEGGVLLNGDFIKPDGRPGLTSRAGSKLTGISNSFGTQASRNAALLALFEHNPGPPYSRTEH